MSETTGSRPLKHGAAGVTIRMHPALARWVKSEMQRISQVRAEREGIEISPGEQKGFSYAMGRLFAWLASLSEEDLLRIQREGDADFERLRLAGRGARLGIEPRQGSVFAPDPPSVGDPGDVPLHVDGVPLAARRLGRRAKHRAG